MISRPIKEVFAFVADPENLPKWASRTYDVTKTSAAAIGVGTTFLGVGRFLEQRIESAQEVIEYEPNRKYVIKSRSGPLTFVFHYFFEPVEGGAKIIFIGEVEPGHFLKVAEPIFVSAVRRLCETDLRHLKELLEARPIANA
jgi:uncharacterized protein YndB with AHSA1/START domain